MTGTALPYVLLIGNYMFPFDERWAIWHFRETWRKRTYEYPSGKRKADGRHDSGKKHGHWTYYYESGASRSGGSYDRGKKVGKWTYWDEEGKVTSERWYLDDREVPAREYRDSVP